MLLASIASVASILCLCCLWCTRSSAQQLARSRHSNTNVGFAVYTLHVHLACTPCMSMYFPGCYWCKVCDGMWFAAWTGQQAFLLHFFDCLLQFLHEPAIPPLLKILYNILTSRLFLPVRNKNDRTKLYELSTLVWKPLYTSKQLSSPIPRL